MLHESLDGVLVIARRAFAVLAGGDVAWGNPVAVGVVRMIGARRRVVHRVQGVNLRSRARRGYLL